MLQFGRSFEIFYLIHPQRKVKNERVKKAKVQNETMQNERMHNDRNETRHGK